MTKAERDELKNLRAFKRAVEKILNDMHLDNIEEISYTTDESED